MRKLLTVETSDREELVDITEKVRVIVKSSWIRSRIVSLYIRGSTAALMIQEKLGRVGEDRCGQSASKTDSPRNLAA